MRRSRKPALVILGAAVGALGAAALVMSVASGDATRTAPGTVLAGLPAGELDATGLRALLRAQEPPTSVKVTMGAVATNVPSAQIVPAVDVEGTVRKALRESGDNGRWFGLGTARGSAVELVLKSRPATFDATVTTLVKAAVQPETHGDLSYRNKALVVLPPRNGQRVPDDRVRSALVAYTTTLPYAEVLPIKVDVEAGHVTMAQLEELASRASVLLEPGLTVAAGPRTRVVSPSELGPQLTVDDDEGLADGSFDLQWRASVTAALVKPIVASLSVEAREPKVTAPVPTRMLDAKGTTSWKPAPAATSLAKEGMPGHTVTDASVRAELDPLLRSPIAAAQLSVTPATVPPLTTDAQARAINSVLGTFTTSFTCCPPRVTNIKLIARTIDGTLIGPGQRFSLNGIVGKRTKAKGYVDAPYILDGELSTDVGGGVSQFATTAMNAAFFAGQHLDRHQAHSFYISRYPAGREATVNFPGIDLAWTNTTSAGILVRTSTTDTTLTVALYGANDGRLVTGVTGPRQPVPGRDFRVTIVRTVEVPGRPVGRSSFTTTYNKPPEEP